MGQKEFFQNSLLYMTRVGICWGECIFSASRCFRVSLFLYHNVDPRDNSPNPTEHRNCLMELLGVPRHLKVYEISLFPGFCDDIALIRFVREKE